MCVLPEGDPRLFGPGSEAFSCLPGHRGLGCRYQSNATLHLLSLPPIFFFSIFFGFLFPLVYPATGLFPSCSLEFARCFVRFHAHELYVFFPLIPSSITVTFFLHNVVLDMIITLQISGFLALIKNHKVCVNRVARTAGVCLWYDSRGSLCPLSTFAAPAGSVQTHPHTPRHPLTLQPRNYDR